MVEQVLVPLTLALIPAPHEDIAPNSRPSFYSAICDLALWVEGAYDLGWNWS